MYIYVIQVQVSTHYSLLKIYIYIFCMFRNYLTFTELYFNILIFQKTLHFLYLNMNKNTYFF